MSVIRREAVAERVGRREARLGGAAAVVVAIGSILAATVLSPSFEWATGALSDMGTDPTTAWLFNGGLVLGALLGLPFAWALWTGATDLMGRLRAASFLVAILGMGGVGLFPAGRTLHVPTAFAFYVFATLTLIVDGAARFRTRAGKLAIGFGLLVPLAWPTWALWLSLGPGIAVPEFVGAALFAVWVVLLSPERPAFGEPVHR